jgi:hypothetical protein
MEQNQAFRGFLGRFVLGFMLFAWANAFAAPCLMAMDTNAVTAEEAEHSGHGDHARDDHSAHQDSSTECDHCPGDAGHDSKRCTSGVSADCGVTLDASTEFRKAEYKFKDVATVRSPPVSLSESLRQGRRHEIPPVDILLVNWRIDPALFIQHNAYLK